MLDTDIKPKKRKPPKRDEEKHQVALVRWFEKQYPHYRKLLTLGSIGENVGGRRMNRLKAMGYTPGHVDLVLHKVRVFPIHHPLTKTSNGYTTQDGAILIPGLHIELKVKGGRVSAEQKDVHNLLTIERYLVKVCWDWIEAQQVITQYLHT